MSKLKQLREDLNIITIPSVMKVTKKFEMKFEDDCGKKIFNKGTIFTKRFDFMDIDRVGLSDSEGGYFGASKIFITELLKAKILKEI